MSKKILVTGSEGLVGSAIYKIDKKENDTWIYVSRDYGGDLRNKDNVDLIFKTYKPDYVIHTAAKVGGIGGNEACHGSFFYDNILMNTYIIDAAMRYKVKKLLVFSSVCVFPDNLSVLQEDRMHDGPAYTSNFAYAYAKRMVDVQIQAYKKQYDVKNYCSVIPGNIFGKHDWYNIQNGHVIPSLIHKLYLAKQNNTPFEIWGDGQSLREFLYVDDVARILVNLLELDTLPDRLIISGDTQYSIRDIVNMLVKVSNFSGEVRYDTSKPNGQRSRQSDLSRLTSLFDMKYTPIEEAIKISWDWFVSNYPNVRL